MPVAPFTLRNDCIRSSGNQKHARIICKSYFNFEDNVTYIFLKKTTMDVLQRPKIMKAFPSFQHAYCPLICMLSK